jgi:autotransporter strand-loop-strand O-heptosyltransferase
MSEAEAKQDVTGVGHPEQDAAAPAPAKPAEPQPKSSFPPPASMPTLSGPQGIRYDFNHGARVSLPPREAGQWRIRLRDIDTGNILFQSDNQGAVVRSSKRWFVRFQIDVWELAADGAETAVFSHTFDLAGKNVLIQFPVGTLGDVLAWFTYAARFAEVHPECKVICALSGLIIPVLRDAYPNLRLVTHEELEAEKLQDTAYATYSLGLFFDDTACEWQPTDFRHVGLHKTAAYILGVSPHEEAPRLAIEDDSRPIAEPYAVIAVQSSSGCKYWNNPTGWRDVVAYLKTQGLQVVCIDQKPVHGHGLMWTHIPHGVQDETGDRPLAERARWLKHAAVFVGLSSGLAWLAWAARTKVVLISGFTHPTNEFETPYRVINWHACNSCWNDPALRFDHKDFLWCPRHANTPRQFECTRLITGAAVTNTIARALKAAPEVSSF